MLCYTESNQDEAFTRRCCIRVCICVGRETALDVLRGV